MSYKLGVAKLKRQFSEVLDRVSRGRERIYVERRGRTVAVMIPPTEEADQDIAEDTPPKGLLAAVGAWADFPDLDGFVQHIHRSRARARDREVEALR
jgi:prevent-host-death family protein